MKAYSWRDAYRSAALETDPTVMPNRIDTAQKAIEERLNDGLCIDETEQQEIENAQRGIVLLKSEMVGNRPFRVDLWKHE